jgi:ribonuclease P protein component
VLIASEGACGHSRIGFSIGSRSVRLATRRVRLKRCLREAFRKNKKRFKSGFDMIVVVKKDPGRGCGGKFFEAQLLALMKETGVIG